MIETSKPGNFDYIANVICNRLHELNRKFTKNLIFSGKSRNWQAVLNYGYIEEFKLTEEGKAAYRKTIKRSYEIRYTGSPVSDLAKIHYEFVDTFGRVFMDGNQVEKLENGKVIIKGKGRGTHSSEVPIEKINEIVLGSTGGRFPDKKEIILLKINLNGKEETLELTTR